MSTRIELGTRCGGNGSDGKLGGSVALITGGGRGIGRLLAQALARAGAAVGLVARSRDQLEETVLLIESSGGVAVAATADVSDEHATAAALQRLRHALGPVDLLVNNAGICGPVGPAWDVDPDFWWRTLEVNLRSVFICTRLVLPDMLTRRRGRVVNITSQAGVFRWPQASAYAVSKAAVVKFTENLAFETRGSEVRVFSVHPGLLPIGLSEAAIAGNAPLDSAEGHLHTWIRQQLADGRGADPARAAELVVRLAAGEADELSGCHVSVHDDLDAVLSRIDDVRRDDLYLLRLRGLAEEQTTSDTVDLDYFSGSC